MQDTKRPEMKKLFGLAKGENPLHHKRLTMTERVEFLEDFKKYAEKICGAIDAHNQLTPQNIHNDKHIEDSEAVKPIVLSLELLKDVKQEGGKDGNHHKAARYYRKIIDPLYEVAQELTNISSDFDRAYRNTELHVESRFRLETHPKDLLIQFEDLLLKAETNKIKNMPQWTPKQK